MTWDSCTRAVEDAGYWTVRRGRPVFRNQPKESRERRAARAIQTYYWNWPEDAHASGIRRREEIRGEIEAAS